MSYIIQRIIYNTNITFVKYTIWRLLYLLYQPCSLFPHYANINLVTCHIFKKCHSNTRCFCCIQIGPKQHVNPNRCLLQCIPLQLTSPPYVFIHLPLPMKKNETKKKKQLETRESARRGKRTRVFMGKARLSTLLFELSSPPLFSLSPLSPLSLSLSPPSPFSLSLSPPSLSLYTYGRKKLNIMLVID